MPATTVGIAATTDGIAATTDGIVATTDGIAATTDGIAPTADGIGATTNGIGATTNGIARVKTILPLLNTTKSREDVKITTGADQCLSGNWLAGKGKLEKRRRKSYSEKDSQTYQKRTQTKLIFDNNRKEHIQTRDKNP